MRICVVNTGGTISCAGEPLTPMSASLFAQASKKMLVPILANEFPRSEIIFETGLHFDESENGMLDSTNLQPENWCKIADYILENYQSFDAFVILHGTDTMDFSGSALPFLLNVFDAKGFGKAVLTRPVIITGSQVPMFHSSKKEDFDVDDLSLNFNTDAFQNFCGAVACARLGIPDVGVYFDSKLFRGNRVLKINASEFLAFNSPNYPELAQYGIELTQYPSRMIPGPVSNDVSLDNDAARQIAKDQLKAITAVISDYPVMQFNAFPAAYSKDKGTALLANLINACVGQDLKGLVLQSYGEGNFPSGNPDNPESGAIFKALNDANSKGVVIVDATQVLAGTVDESAYAAGAWLPQIGALSASDMTSMAAFTKTMILLAARNHNGWSLDEVKTLIQLNLAGEVMNVSRLDSRTNAELVPGQSIMALDGGAILSNHPIYGPRFTDSQDNTLWAPLNPSASTPGRLIMQDDGNLVFRDTYNNPIWASDTGQADGASSVLMINGSFAGGDLELVIYSYSSQKTAAVLYSQKDQSGREEKPVLRQSSELAGV